MTERTWDYLKQCHGLIVLAEDLLDAARLVEDGYARAADEREGIIIYRTTAGDKLIS